VGGLKGYETIGKHRPGVEGPAHLLAHEQPLSRPAAFSGRVGPGQKPRYSGGFEAGLSALLAVTRCFHYPPPRSDHQADPKPNRHTVAEEMTRIIQETQPTGRIQHAQLRMLGQLKRRWELFGEELLYCYAIPGLPQDNLKLESLFGRLRRHQRRISGRPSTRELQVFGQAQILLTASSFQALLEQIQQVPRERYQIHRQR